MLAGLFASLGFLTGWVGLAALIVYLFILSAFFDDNWLVRGIIAISIPVGIAIGLGVLGVPSLKIVVYYLLGYLAVGIVWSLFRWRILVGDLRTAIEEIVSKVTDWEKLAVEEKGRLLLHELTIAKDYTGWIFSAHLNHADVSYNLNLIPHLENWANKGRVASWITSWPLSALNYIYNRLLKDIVDFLVEKMKGVYHLIAANVMKGLKV